MTVSLERHEVRPLDWLLMFLATGREQILIPWPFLYPPIQPTHLRVQDLCESRGGRPGLPSLISLQFLWT